MYRYSGLYVTEFAAIWQMSKGLFDLLDQKIENNPKASRIILLSAIASYLLIAAHESYQAPDRHKFISKLLMSLTSGASSVSSISALCFKGFIGSGSSVDKPVEAESEDDRCESVIQPGRQGLF